MELGARGEASKLASYRLGEAAMGELMEEPERSIRAMPMTVPRMRTPASTRKRAEPLWDLGKRETPPLLCWHRFLLYTDGVTETENAAGEAFGDRQLERIRHRCLARRYAHFCLGGPLHQQDDITLIVVDVL
jgi:hypothetical protein